jgi:general secretion pathway protein G
MTLVEIMVVIAIIGTLMAVLAVNMADKLQEGYRDATVLQIKQIEQNLQLYAAKHKGKYPTTSDGLAKAQKYFPNNEVPKDAWGYDFLYFSPGTHGDNDYEIISLGKDGAEGGSDWDKDIKSYALEELDED